MNSSSKPRVLITGIAGFIGSNLADRLIREGYPVVGIDNLAYGVREQIPAGAEFHEMDIRSKDIYPMFESVDMVFHLAAKNSLIDCQQDPVETLDINVTGTTNVFEAARRANVKKVMYAQSSVLEEGEARLKGFYAISKRADELVADGYHDAFGVTTVGLRYFNVYGPRQDYRRTLPPVMSKFIMTLLRGETPVLFEGDDDNKRDFVHVDDINDFHLLCMNDDRVNNRWFRIGSGKNYSIKDLLDITQSVMGTNIQPRMAARIAGDPVATTLADISEATALGWKPKVAIEDGLRGMVDYIRGVIDKS